MVKKIAFFVVVIAAMAAFVYGLFAWKNQSWPFSPKEAPVEEVVTPEAEIDISND